MYNQNVNKYNVAINRLNREIAKLKQALFEKQKKCKDLQSQNSKLSQKIEIQAKEIQKLNKLKAEKLSEPSTKTRTYKKKK